MAYTYKKEKDKKKRVQVVPKKELPVKLENENLKKEADNG